MFISSRHLTVCFSVQPLARLLRPTITTCFPSFPRFPTHSLTRPLAATTVRQTTSTLTTCHGALRSSRRRPNLSEAHVCPHVRPVDGIFRRRGAKKKRSPDQIINPKSSSGAVISNYFRHQCNIYLMWKKTHTKKTKRTGVFLVEVILIITSQHEGSDGIFNTINQDFSLDYCYNPFF